MSLFGKNKALCFLRLLQGSLPVGQTRNSAPAKRAPLWIHTVQRVLPVHRHVRVLDHSIDVLLLVLVQLVRVGTLVDQRLALVVLELFLLPLSNLPTGSLDDIDRTVVADDAQAGVVDVEDKDGLGHGRGDDDADDEGHEDGKGQRTKVHCHDAVAHEEGRGQYHRQKDEEHQGLDGAHKGKKDETSKPLQAVLAL